MGRYSDFRKMLQKLPRLYCFLGPVSLNPDGVMVSAHLCSESCAIKALSKWMASLQSANAGKSQANDSPEERQTISDQRLKKVLDL